MMLTNFDKAFEKYIRSEINKKFPKDSIIGERSVLVLYNVYRWIIDPIDGTRAFVIGAPTWSNLVGLSFKNESLLGLANFPELNKYYINDKKKSYVCKEGKKYILKSSKNHNLKTIKIIGNFHGTLSYEKQKKIIKKFSCLRLAGFDALNYCLLAEGRVDAVIEANLKPYDILPLVPIIRNSGAIVTNWNGDPPVNPRHISNTFLLLDLKKNTKVIMPIKKKKND